MKRNTQFYKLSYEALLPAIFTHINEDIDIAVLVDFIKTELLGDSHLEYLGNGEFKTDNEGFKTFTNISASSVENLYKSIEKGYSQIDKNRRGA